MSAGDLRMPVVILCGGRGTRLQEHTHAIPKALVEIGAKPILWHVIRIYAAQGWREFVLLTGYRGEMIADFIAGEDWPEEVEIECLDTGRDTPTGGRVAHARERLAAGPFCLTYADGVADLDLAALVDFHRAGGSIATMTVVRPRSQFGITDLGYDGWVLGFEEKPCLEHWVNGGFFCFETAFLDYVAPDSVLERGPLERLVADGELRAFRHTGFWDCMDTYKDAVVLNDLWRAGEAPWRVWDRRARARTAVR
jgi:glucose-1-phosphate cytidylyltransferase